MEEHTHRRTYTRTDVHTKAATLIKLTWFVWVLFRKKLGDYFSSSGALVFLQEFLQCHLST